MATMVSLTCMSKDDKYGDLWVERHTTEAFRSWLFGKKLVLVETTCPCQARSIEIGRTHYTIEVLIKILSSIMNVTDRKSVV